MAISLEMLCQNADYLYGMRVLAGFRGMKNIVQWVHTIENVNAINFLHGGELVFTTGIAASKAPWLLDFVKQLIKNKSAGLVVNTGQYIIEIPKEVLKYSDMNGFPILEVPWKTKLVDITRDFCNQIISNEQKDRDIMRSLQKIITESEGIQPYIDILQKYQFNVNDCYTIAALKIGKDTKIANIDATIHEILEKITISANKTIQIMQVKSVFIIIFLKCESDYIRKVIENISELCNNNKIIIAMGISSNIRQIQMLKKSYIKALRIMNLAESRKQPYLFFDQLQHEKLFVSIDDDKILSEYYEHTLSKLVEYDQKHSTDYVELLRKYILYDGSIQRIANETNQHRNTIHYQINKIKSILEIDITSIEEKFKIMLAFQVKCLSQ